MVCRRIVILLLSILIVGPSISAGAQTPAASSIPAEEELTGLQAAVWRSYAPAGGFVGSTVIDVSEATPVASPEAMRRLRSVSVVIREFDSADNAAMAFERISAGAEETMVRVFTVGEQEITSETLPDIGAQATLVRIDHAGEGSEVWMENVIVQRDR